MKLMVACIAVALMAVALIPAAFADDAPLTPDEVLAKLQTIVCSDGGDGANEMGDLLAMPATEDEQELAGYASFITFTVMMLSEAPQQPAVMEDQLAVVTLHPQPVEFVLVQDEGKWKVDMAATFKRLPEKLRLSLVPERTPEEKQQQSCLSKVKQLGIVAMMYAQDHDETLPEADKWMDQLLPYLMNNEDILKCPAAPELEYGYAMNEALSGMKLDNVKDVSATVLFFESALGTRNASGGPAAVCEPGRHNEGNNYSYVDGHAQWSTSVPSFDPVGERPAPEEGPVLDVTDATFEDEVLKAEGWVLVDMWAEWCGPCIRLKPVFSAMAAEYEERAKFVSVDVDANPKTAETYGAPPIPLILLFRDGELVDKQLGFGQEQSFRAWVSGHVD